LRGGDRRVCRLRQLVDASRAKWADQLHLHRDDDVLHDDAVARTRHGYEFFFSSNILVSAAAVYLVDVNAAPVGCTTAWTAMSANRDAVQLSPAGGSGRGQVELFIPQNTGLARSTAVSIAGWQAIVSQAGR